MKTIKDMNKYLENNPVYKRIIENKNMYFFEKWIEKKFNEKANNSLLEKEKEFIFQCRLLMNITEKQIQQSLQLDAFKKIEKLLYDFINGDDAVVDELYKMYIDNVNIAKSEYQQKILDLKYSCLPKKKRKEIDTLKTKGNNDKVKIIMDNYTKYGEKVRKAEKSYDAFCEWVDIFDIYQFDAELLKENKSFIPLLAFAINSPNFLMPTGVDILLNQKKELPSSWYLHTRLTILEYRNLLSKDNNQQKWNYLFNKAKQSILDKINLPILPIIKRRKLLNSIIENFQNKQYDSALIIAFSVIEGLLWELSYEVNKKEKVFVKNVSTMYDYKKEEEFQSTRIRDVIERTVVKEYLDEEFVKEFCKEIYEERNLVLHGNRICHYECKKLAICFVEKLFVLDYLLNIIEELYQENLFDEWDKSVDSKKIDECIELFYKENEGLEISIY